MSRKAFSKYFFILLQIKLIYFFDWRMIIQEYLIKESINIFQLKMIMRATIYLIKKFNQIFKIVLLIDSIFSKREKRNAKTFMEIISSSRKNESYCISEQIIMRQSINKNAKKMNRLQCFLMKNLIIIQFRYKLRNLIFARYIILEKNLCFKKFKF